MIQYDSINLSNFEMDSDNDLSDENADSDGKIIATLGTDCRVYPTVEGSKIAKQNNLMNYKIRTLDDYSCKSYSGLNIPASVVDLGKKLLQYARDSNVAGVKNTISRGAAFTADWLGMTALHFAAMNNQYEICEIILDGGVNKDLKTKVDRTPLHLACYYGHYRIVELLLSRKCNVNAKDMLCMTPLHWAVEKRFKSIVHLLLRHDADVSIVSKFDRTPIAIAVLTEQPDILEELKAAKIKQMNRIHNEKQEKETSDAVNSITNKIETDKCKRDSNDNQIMKNDVSTALSPSSSSSPSSQQNNTGNFNDLPLVDNIKEETAIITEPDIELFQSPAAMSVSNDEDSLNESNHKTDTINSVKKCKGPLTLNSNTVDNDSINDNLNHNNSNNNPNQNKTVNNNNDNNDHHSNNSNISNKIKSIVPVRFKNGKTNPLQRITYFNKTKPNIISRSRNSNASTTVISTATITTTTTTATTTITTTTTTNNNNSSNTKAKNIRIISLNEFNKLYGDGNLKNVQKLTTSHNNSSFICSQRMVNLRDLQSRPQQLKLPMANSNSDTGNSIKGTGINSKSTIASNNIKNNSSNIITKNIINHINSNSGSKNIIGHQNSSFNHNTKRSINILNRADLNKTLKISSENDVAEEKRLPARNVSKLESSSTSKDNADTTSSGTKPKKLLLPARCLEQYVNLKMRNMPSSLATKQNGSSNQRQSIGERKCVTTGSNTGNPPTTVLPLLTLPEICRQLLELRRQNDELRRKYDLAQKDKDDLKRRVQRLEEFLIDPKTDES